MTNMGNYSSTVELDMNEVKDELMPNIAHIRQSNRDVEVRVDERTCEENVTTTDTKRRKRRYL